MSVKCRSTTMAVIRQEQAIYLVSKNKRICVWNQRLVYIRNVQVVRASKLIGGINLRIHKYRLSKVLIDADDSNNDPENARVNIELTPVTEHLSPSAIAN